MTHCWYPEQISLRAKGITLSVAAFVVLAGCAVAPDVEQPAPEHGVQPAPEMPALITVVNSPLRFSGAEPYMRLDAASSDPSYGFSHLNPIQIGGGFPDGDMDIYRYLNALLDPDGNPISYSRLGTCCAYFHDPGLFGTGKAVIDVYLIQYDALDAPLRIYFDTFNFKKPVAPKGLRYQMK